MNEIICGDSIEMMKKMADESVDLIITSPPYNLKNSTGNGMKWGRGSGMWTNVELTQGYTNHGDNMPRKEYIQWIRDNLCEMFRVLKPNGAIFFNHKFRVQGGLMQGHTEILEGFNVRQMIIWARSGGMNFNDTYFLPTYEVVYVMPKTPKGKNTFKLKKGANRMGDVWRIHQDTKNKHPAPMPTKLVSTILQSCEKGIVLDPFGGSGTTAIAAIDEGWDYILIDNSEEYCGMANNRIAKHQHLYTPSDNK